METTRRPRRLRTLARYASVVVAAGSGCVLLLQQGQSRDRYLRQRPSGLSTYTAEGVSMRVASSVGQSALPTVLLIHGSPGGWDAWADLLMDGSFAERYHALAVDRPGFGESRPGVPEPSLAAQARMIAPVLDGRGPAIVVGHSMGGPVAVQLALDFPGKVAGLVLVAASVDPAQEKRAWFQDAARLPWLRPLVPTPLMVSNEELYDLKAELEVQAARWKELGVPVYAIQGLEDDLVPAANADFIESRLPAEQLTVVRVAGQDHFIPWNRPELIVEGVDAVAAIVAAGGPR